MFNAGVQSAEKTIFTKDRLEQTFAVNHLAHFVLLRKIGHLITPDAIIGWVGSGIGKIIRLYGSILHRSRAARQRRIRRWNKCEASKPQCILNVQRFKHYHCAAFLASGFATHFFLIWSGPDAKYRISSWRKRGRKMGMEIYSSHSCQIYEGHQYNERSSEMLSQILLKKKKNTTSDYVEYTGTLLKPYLPKNEESYSQLLCDYSDRFVNNISGV